MQDDFNLYIIAELTYKKRHANIENLFPFNWYSSKNYRIKTEIIADALKNNIKIEDTNLYQIQFNEGIKKYKITKNDD